MVVQKERREIEMKLTKERMTNELFYRIENDLDLQFTTGLEIAAEFYEAMSKIEEFQKLALNKYGMEGSRIEFEGEHITGIKINLIVTDFDIYMDKRFSKVSGEFTEKMNREYCFDFSVIYERIENGSV